MRFVAIESLGAALSLSEFVSGFFGDKVDLRSTPLPRPTNCSPNCAAIRDSVSSLWRTGKFRRTGISGEWCVGEQGWCPLPEIICNGDETLSCSCGGGGEEAKDVGTDLGEESLRI